MEWAAANAPGAAWVASFACDTPFFPEDMVARMVTAVEAARSQGGGADLACAVTHGRTHPVFGLWPVALRDALRRAMVERSEEHTSELQSLMRISYAVFCLKKTTHT